MPLQVGRETIVFPGYDGGAEWGGAAFDPETSLLYVNANEMAWTGSLAPDGLGAAAARALPARLRVLPSGRWRARRRRSRRSSASARGAARGDQRTSSTRASGRMPGFPPLTADDIERARRLHEDGPVARRRARRGRARPEVPLHRLPEVPRSRRLPGVAPPWGTLTAIDLNTRRARVAGPARRLPGARREGPREHRQRELRRARRDRRRPRLHRRDQLRQEVPRVRQGDGRAAVGGDAARSPAPARRRPTRSPAASSWSFRRAAARTAADGRALRRVRAAGAAALTPYQLPLAPPPPLSPPPPE